MFQAFGAGVRTEHLSLLMLRLTPCKSSTPHISSQTPRAHKNNILRIPKDFWDKGVDALKSFTMHHVCNTLCDAMDLDDITGVDFDKIVCAAEQRDDEELSD